MINPEYIEGKFFMHLYTVEIPNDYNGGGNENSSLKETEENYD